MKELNTFLTSNFEAEREKRPFRMHRLDCKENIQMHQNIDSRSDNQFIVIFKTGGSGSLFIEFEKTAITDNHLLIVKPGDFHKFRLSNGFKGYAMSFMLSFFDASDPDAESLYDRVYQMFAETRLVSIEGDAFIDMQDIMETLLKEFTRHNLYRSQILKRYFNVFLIHLLEQFKIFHEPAGHRRNNEIFCNFITLLEKYFRTKKKVADYADMLSVTPNYLNEVIKKVTGISAGCHIRKRIAHEAKRQAVYTNTCMKAIAYDLGFLDLANFSKFFRNTTGINFSNLRKFGPCYNPLINETRHLSTISSATPGK